MSARPVDLGTKLLLVDLTKVVKLRALGGEAEPLLARYEAWLEAQRLARANYGKLGRPKFVVTPEKQAVLESWARTNPRPALNALAAALSCSIGKAHALAKALPAAVQIHGCQQCGGEGELGCIENEPHTGPAVAVFDVICSQCPNRTAQRDTEMEAIMAWNTANPVKI